MIFQAYPASCLTVVSISQFFVTEAGRTGKSVLFQHFVSHAELYFEGKNLMYGHFWGTSGRSLGREGGVVRTKRGF